MEQKNKNIFQNELDRIKSELSKQPGFSRMSKEKQKELTERIKKAILQRLFLEIFEKLNEKDRDGLRGLIENESSPREMDEFLRGRVENYDSVIGKIADQFVEDMKKEI